MPTMPTQLIPVTRPGGYSHRGPGGARRSEVAGGFSRYALEWGRGTQIYNVTLALNVIQNQIWQIFYLHTIKKGTIPFTMQLDSGMGIGDHTVHLVPNSLNTTYTNGTSIIVSFDVEAESTVYALSDAEVTSYLEVYELYGGTGTNSMDLLLAQLAQFATVDSDVLDY